MKDYWLWEGENTGRKTSIFSIMGGVRELKICHIVFIADRN